MKFPNINNLFLNSRGLMILFIALLSFTICGAGLFISYQESVLASRLVYFALVLNFIIGISSIVLAIGIFHNVARRIHFTLNKGLALNEKSRQVKGLQDELSLLEHGLVETNLSLKQKNITLETQREELLRLANFRQNLSIFVGEALRQGLAPNFYERLLKCAIEGIPGSQAGSLLLKKGDSYHYETVVNYNFTNFQDVSISADDIALVFSDTKPSHFSDFSLSLQVDVLENIKGDNSPTGRQLAVRDSLGIPVLIDGVNVAFLTLDNFEQPHVFDEEAVGMAEIFATQIGVVLKRLNLETELQTRQAEIERKNAELEQANRLKSEFLANMSHELRTPLTSIIGFAELLGEEIFGSLNQKQKQYAKDIFNSGNHLLLLINDILDLSKIESGHMELDLDECDVSELVDSVIEIMNEPMRKAKISCHIRMSENLDFAYVDQRKIKQVLFNLIANAIKFTAEGGSIEVSVSEQDNMFRFSVQDTGIGIAEENLSKLFKEFSQIDSSLARRHEGTGLGLALSKRLVELHKGNIGVESQLGEGSNFYFFIPKHHTNPEIKTNSTKETYNLWQTS